MLEEERKYGVNGRFVLPDLSSCLPVGGRVLAQPRATLTATYYDTADLRLARAGVSLRYRRGDSRPWTVKLPAGGPGVRHEVSRAGSPGDPPADLVELVTVYARTAPLRPAAVVRTTRQAYELRDADGTVLAELADDSVAVLDGRRVTHRFREIEVERKAGRRRLLDQVGQGLREAGAATDEFVPKHVRALGEAARDAPDLPAPEPLPRRPTAGDVVVRAIRQDVRRILEHDPLVRQRSTVEGDDTAVHQMRVGCRRLRSHLRTFAPLLDGDRRHRLRGEVGWLADRLGAARDAEVMRTRLRATAASDPLAPLDEAAVVRIDADLAVRLEDAMVELDAALRSDRYRALVEALIELARAPALTPMARRPAADVLPRLVSRAWRALAFGGRNLDGAGDLEAEAPDARWHAVRIRGKRARYAVEAVADAVGRPAAKLAVALAAVQESLGEHQDAATAAETWLSIALSDPDDHTLAVTAGRLYERERGVVRRVRVEFPKLWAAATKPKLTAWLP